MRLHPPSAVLFDVGDTLLVEQRFDLDAGIAAAVGRHTDFRAIADAFRAETLKSHERHEELRLAAWLQHRVPALARRSVDWIEEQIWPAVTLVIDKYLNVEPKRLS